MLLIVCWVDKLLGIVIWVVFVWPMAHHLVSSGACHFLSIGKPSWTRPPNDLVWKFAVWSRVSMWHSMYHLIIGRIILWCLCLQTFDDYVCGPFPFAIDLFTLSIYMFPILFRALLNPQLCYTYRESLWRVWVNSFSLLYIIHTLHGGMPFP